MLTLFLRLFPYLIFLNNYLNTLKMVLPFKFFWKAWGRPPPFLNRELILKTQNHFTASILILNQKIYTHGRTDCFLWWKMFEIAPCICFNKKIMKFFIYVTKWKLSMNENWKNIPPKKSLKLPLVNVLTKNDEILHWKILVLHLTNIVGAKPKRGCCPDSRLIGEIWGSF